MNPYPRVSLKMIKTGLWCPTWKTLSKTARWTFLDMWSQEDDVLFHEMSQSDKDLKPTPFFARAHPEMKRASEDRRKARKTERVKNRQGDNK